MKKILVISCSIICIILVSFVCLNYNKTNINEKIKITVSEFSVKDLSLDDIYYAYELSDEVRKKINDNTKNYKIISAYYLFENLSEDTTMEDVRFYPVFDKGYSKDIVFYNSGNEEYYIYVEPGCSGGMQQDIIVYAPGKSAEKICDEVKGQKVKLVYYAGLFGYSTGQGYAGLGSHSIEFRLNNS